MQSTGVSVLSNNWALQPNLSQEVGLGCQTVHLEIVLKPVTTNLFFDCIIVAQGV